MIKLLNNTHRDFNQHYMYLYILDSEHKIYEFCIYNHHKLHIDDNGYFMKKTVIKSANNIIKN